MSIVGAMRMALWTEIRDAMLKDFPDLRVPHEAPPALEGVVRNNANFMAELVDDLKEHRDGRTR